jgi:hypothetical protein
MKKQLDRNGRLIHQPVDPKDALQKSYRSIRGKLQGRAVITNANRSGVYRTGDGDVPQPPRPGSLHAFTLPSLINGRRVLRGMAYD